MLAPTGDPAATSRNPSSNRRCRLAALPPRLRCSLAICQLRCSSHGRLASRHARSHWRPCRDIPEPVIEPALPAGGVAPSPALLIGNMPTALLVSRAPCQPTCSLPLATLPRHPGTRHRTGAAGWRRCPLACAAHWQYANCAARLTGALPADMLAPTGDPAATSRNPSSNRRCRLAALPPRLRRARQWPNRADNRAIGAAVRV